MLNIDDREIYEVLYIVYVSALTNLALCVIAIGFLISDVLGLSITAGVACLVIWHCLIKLRRRNAQYHLAKAKQRRLAAAAPQLFTALQDCRTDLRIQAGNAFDAAKTDPRWDGVYDTLMARVQQANAAITAATKRPIND